MSGARRTTLVDITFIHFPEGIMTWFKERVSREDTLSHHPTTTEATND